MNLFGHAALVLAVSFLSTLAHAVDSEPVQVKPVAVTDSGRMIVQSNGSTFIELQPHEFNQRTAQEMYEQSRAKFSAMIAEEEAARANKNMEFDPADRAGIYRNPNTNPPIKDSFYGFSLTDGKRVSGSKYIPTRDQRLYSRTDTYIMTDSGVMSGIVASANCRNPQGVPDVMNVNFGHNGCFGVIKIFKKLK